MKLTTILAAAAVTMAPAASAWRLYIYNWEDQNKAGGYYTNSGPGNPGRACHSVSSALNNKGSSIEYYAGNRQSNPTTRCGLKLYDGAGCTGASTSEYRYDVKMNLAPLLEGWNNRVSSFSTNCYLV
ncbi:hypothetical protein jhhlp_007763 [Lomentospora prolificans]|uniref:Uncharacterized protein n=1 Tax=Lomentospora prolificans TaxID=41688 RepID=A0A2N3N0H5_9PEZI|nr:hypothetical protein jhhlp_007763 [Lomentospora prolificans]